MRVPRSSLRVGAILGGWRVGSHGGAPVGVAWEAVGGCFGVSFGSGEYGGGGARLQSACGTLQNSEEWVAGVCAESALRNRRCGIGVAESALRNSVRFGQ